MARSGGLSKKQVPIFVGGGLDTKVDPRLMPADSAELIQLDNMWMARTGELRLRNGFTSLSKLSVNGNAIASVRSLFANQRGGIGMVADGIAAGPPSARTILDFDAPTSRWLSAGADANPLPLTTAAVFGVEATQRGNGAATVNDLVDCDAAVTNGYMIAAWTEEGGAGKTFRVLTNEATGIAVSTAAEVRIPSPTGRRPRCAALTTGGNSFFCVFYLDNSGVPSLLVDVVSMAGSVATATVVLTGVSAAQPWFDVKPKPGGSTILVAYRDNAGGVSCLEFNPNTRTVVTGPVNTAGADATMVLGWLDDALATGSFLLATGGGTSGVVVRTMNAALAVTATNVIDATATAGLRNITGYVNTGAANYVVLWDVDATPTFNMLVRQGAWTGSAAVVTYIRSFGLSSRAFKASDGLFYFLASYDSTTQATYALIQAGIDLTTTQNVSSQCNLMAISAGGRTVAANCLTSVYSTASGKYAAAVTRRQKVTAANGNFLTTRSISSVRFDFAAPFARARELGGTLFVPGGLPLRFDGASASWSATPFAPEAPTCVSSATGSMTPGGSYDYFDVYRRTDAAGRIQWSPPSTPTTVVLGAGDGRVTITSSTLRLQAVRSEVVVIEHYRRGPTGTGATAINKIGESGSGATVDTVAFVDSVSDLTASAGQILYTTGGVLENFAPPSHSLLEVANRRVWVVNAEDSTELWPSKEYKPGLGAGWHPNLRFTVTGDGSGGMTALAAMDGALVAFKRSAIYLITGDGPNDQGQGTFNTPRAISLNVGTTLPGSVVATPDGIMFQSAKGIYLLSRGGALEYIGSPVEQYTNAANVIDASLVDAYTQVRFLMASGRCLVWDYFHKRWYSFLLPVGASSAVACANITGGWCFALADGTVKQEVAGQFNDDGAAIVPTISFPNLDLAGINGYQRIYGIQILGEYRGAHTLSVQFDRDYSGALSAAQTIAPTAGVAYQYEAKASIQRCTSIRPVITATFGSGPTEGFRLTGISVEVGIKSGSPISPGNRMT